MEDGEQFEIQIADLNDIDFTGNAVLHEGTEENGYSDVKTSDKSLSGPDLLRASLSDVVLTPSLQLAAREIDLDEDVNIPAANSASFVQDFDAVAVDKNDARDDNGKHEEKEEVIL
jgi:hypothetical protein